jgi:hypothetical protein
MGLFVNSTSTQSRNSSSRFLLPRDSSSFSKQPSYEKDDGIVENFRIRINFKYRQGLNVMTMRRNKAKESYIELQTHFGMKEKTIKIQAIEFLHWTLCHDLNVFFEMDKHSLRDVPVQIEYGYFQGEEESLGCFKDFHDDNFTEEMMDIILEYAKFMLQS